MPNSSRRTACALALGVSAVALALAVQAAPAGAAPITPSHPSVAATKPTSTVAAKRNAQRQAASNRRIRTADRSTATPLTISRLARQARPAADPPTDPTPPATTVPTLAAPGDSGVVSLTATSAAAYVLLEVDGAGTDGQTSPTPIPVAAGSASATYTTWGLANGTSHTVTAADCSTADLSSCNTEAATAAFEVTNAAPVITAPHDGASITGGFTVTATADGGGIQFRVDGVRKSFDSTSPYTFSYTGSALSAGGHTITAVQCSVDESACDGPESSVWITSNSLHPSLSKASPVVFSPNGDRTKDSTTVTYFLPDTETATITVTTAAGTTLRSTALGTHSGKHTWTWNGRTNANKTVASGRYVIRLATSAVRNGATVRGLVTASVTVDLRAPSLTSLKFPTSIYPHHDGYRDTFPVTFRTNETTAASLVILNSRKKVVRTISATHAAGATTLAWNGKDSHQRLVAAGTYGWYLSWHDAVGNKAHTGTRHLTLSPRALVTKHLTVTKNGNSFTEAGGSDTDCAEASTSLSEYVHGVWLDNACDYDFDGLQLASAFYHLALPSAVSYSSVTVDVGGYSLGAPSTMLVGYGKKGGSSDFTIGRRYEISDSREGYWRIGSINPTGLTNSKHVMNVGINVDNLDGTGDFDIATVRFSITYKVLGR